MSKEKHKIALHHAPRYMLAGALILTPLLLTWLVFEFLFHTFNYLLSLENERRNVERVQDIDLYGLPKDYYQKLIPRVRGLDPKEARSLANKYITAEDVVVIVVGDAAEVKAQVETPGQVTVYDTELRVR